MAAAYANVIKQELRRLCCLCFRSANCRAGTSKANIYDERFRSWITPGRNSFFRVDWVRNNESRQSPRPSAGFNRASPNLQVREYVWLTDVTNEMLFSLVSLRVQTQLNSLRAFRLPSTCVCRQIRQQTPRLLQEYPQLLVTWHFHVRYGVHCKGQECKPSPSNGESCFCHYVYILVRNETISVEEKRFFFSMGCILLRDVHVRISQTIYQKSQL
jgi:hypothetical protein